MLLARCCSNISGTMILRFPGQYTDTATALNQNWFRDYDPAIGRYVESDPVGLLGGINTYAYVDGNPLSLKDPSGRLGLVGAGIGAGIGGGGDLAYQLYENGGRLGCVNWGQVAAAAGIGAFIGSGAEFLFAGEALADTIPLFRAVNPAELSDIEATRGFRNPFGTEVKYFSTTEEGASSYAQQTSGTGFYQGPYTIVQTTAPADILNNPLLTSTVDRGISTVTDPTETLPQLGPIQILP